MTPRAVTAAPRSRARSGVSLRRQLWSACAAVPVLALLTWVLVSRGDDVSLAIVFLLYLATVVALSAAGGPLVGVSVAVVAFVLVNWYFSDPVHTLDVADPERVAELVIFLAVSGTVAALVDTAGRRQEVLEVTTAEKEELAAANDLRTALLRAVSHDLRTPLATAKLATSSLLADDVRLDERDRDELLRLADQEIDRLIGIVEDLLDAGRLQAGALAVDATTVSPRYVVELVRAAVPDTDRGDLVVDVPSDLPDVRCDIALLQRVVTNLVANARAADPGGAVQIVGRAGEPGTVTLDVVDHGPGLPAELREAVVRPFHRLEDRGAASGVGLGLPICAGFCEAMGAELHLIDTPGGGLTARIVLEAVT